LPWSFSAACLSRRRVTLTNNKVIKQRSVTRALFRLRCADSFWISRSSSRAHGKDSEDSVDKRWVFRDLD
jgi:hypothetical protein